MVSKNSEGKGDEFNEELASMYETLLFDEDFQQQVKADIQELPNEKRVQLNKRGLRFAEDVEPSEELIQDILKDMQQHTKTDHNTPHSGLMKSTSLWKKLFSWGSDSFSFLSPGVAIPAALAFGIVFGVNATQFLGQGSLQQTIPEATGGQVWRGTSIQTIWLEKIANLIREGKIDQAEIELEKFKQRFPDFKVENTN